jgi:hypothetical protein
MMVGNRKRCFFNEAGLVQCSEWAEYRKDQEVTNLNANDFLKMDWLSSRFIALLTLKYSLLLRRPHLFTNTSKN